MSIITSVSHAPPLSHVVFYEFSLAVYLDRFPQQPSCNMNELQKEVVRTDQEGGMPFNDLTAVLHHRATHLARTCWLNS